MGAGATPLADEADDGVGALSFTLFGGGGAVGADLGMKGAASALRGLFGDAVGAAGC